MAASGGTRADAIDAAEQRVRAAALIARAIHLEPDIERQPSVVAS